MSTDIVARRSSLWQARIPKDLSDAVIADMEALGLQTRAEVLREALTLFHRRAREAVAAREIDEFYGGEPMPLSPVVEALTRTDEPAR